MHMEGTQTDHIKKILNSIGKCLKNIQRKTKDTLAISILKTIQGDRKVMSTTGEQNEFTIL